MLNFDSKKEKVWILWMNSIFSFFKNYNQNNLSFLNLSTLKYLSLWFLSTLLLWSTLLPSNLVSANSDSVFTIEWLNLNQEHISSNWWNNNWNNNQNWTKINENKDEEDKEVSESVKKQRQITVDKFRKDYANSDYIEWYINEDWLKDFCTWWECYISTKTWWLLKFQFITIQFYRSWEYIGHSLLIKNNSLLFFPNVEWYKYDYNFKTKIFWSNKSIYNLCDWKSIERYDANWDWYHDLIVYNKDCKKEVFVNKWWIWNVIWNDYKIFDDRKAYVYEYSKSLSDETLLDWLSWNADLTSNITEVLKQTNSDWTVNYTILWKDSEVIFLWKNLHWINFIDLNWDWLNDIITYEKYIKNWQKYNLINVYQYDKIEKKYKMNLENLESVTIKNIDLNWDWLQDFIVQRLDWKSYFYFNKWLNNQFEVESNIDWDRFDIVDINWDWNQDLISFKFLDWSKDYWTYNIYQRNWTSFDLVNDSNWFLWTNIWEVKNWSNRCLWRYFWWYTSFYVEKWWKRKYIYFNQQDWKYKWFEWVPLLRNDDNYFWCWAWIVEFSSDTDFNKVVYFKDNTWNNEFDYEHSYFNFDTWWSWIFASPWKTPYARKTSHNNIVFSYKKKNEEVISNNYWFFILWNDDHKLYALTSYNSWVYNARRDVWHLVRVWMWNWTDTLYSWSYIFKEAQEAWFYLSSWVLEIRNNNIQQPFLWYSVFQDQKLKDFTKFVLWSDVYDYRISRRNSRDSTLQMREWDKYKNNIIGIYRRYMWM